MIIVTGYDWVPDFARGLVRDLRVRWALEEAGLSYQQKLISHKDKLTPEYRTVQPFSQVPVYQDDEVTLFESGAILLHIARKSDVLLPVTEAGKSLAIQWMFAALNSIEPFIMHLVEIDIFRKGDSWTAERRPQALAIVEKRLNDLSERLQGREWLEDRFTVGDLIMASVLRNLRHTDLVSVHPVLGPYLAHCEARPAFQKALADQMASFKDAP